MKHEKPPSPPPVAFPLPPSCMSTYFTTLLSPPLSNTIRESPHPPFCPSSPYVQL